MCFLISVGNVSKYHFIVSNLKKVLKKLNQLIINLKKTKFTESPNITPVLNIKRSSDFHCKTLHFKLKLNSAAIGKLQIPKGWQLESTFSAQFALNKIFWKRITYFQTFYWTVLDFSSNFTLLEFLNTVFRDYCLVDKIHIP